MPDDFEQDFEEEEEVELETGICGKCGHAFKWNTESLPRCPFCNSKDWVYQDTDPSKCFDLTIRPL